jgi:geranylgeranyl transferase type-1 subunit beta
MAAMVSVHSAPPLTELSAVQVLMGGKDMLQNPNELVEWCLGRQVGGFQGRINKDPDTCYSFWVGASLKMLGAFEFVDTADVQKFLSSCEVSVPLASLRPSF